MSSPKVWLVTGSSSGLGLAVTQQALSKGDNVVVTLRKPEVLSDLASKYASQLLVVKLDVTKQEDIRAAFSAAYEKFGRIDIVYNNAGVLNFLSEAEGTSDEQARTLFEVNFWGAANVTREALRFFREVNKPSGGRLLQASSGSGITGFPLISYYSATKFALEGFTEAISKELDPSWNIKVTLITLGGYRTPAVGSDKVTILPAHPGYENIGNATRTFFESAFKQFGDSYKAAREIYNIANDDRAPARVLVGLDSIAGAKEKAQHYLEQAEKSTAWSADLK
ncbi:NAD(P)-binding protein [Cyathus striatus]|nr:NAD(P)-binding protein [Cyathus striatus]